MLASINPPFKILYNYTINNGFKCMRINLILLVQIVDVVRLVIGGFQPDLSSEVSSYNLLLVSYI